MNREEAEKVQVGDLLVHFGRYITLCRISSIPRDLPIPGWHGYDLRFTGWCTRHTQFHADGPESVTGREDHYSIWVHPRLHELNNPNLLPRHHRWLTKTH